jgi:hypothetical protein
MTQVSRLTESPDPLIKKLMRKLEVSQGIAYADFKGAFDRVNQTIRDMGAKNQVLVIDLAREIPPVKENIADVARCNDRGSRLVAARIAAALTPIIDRLAKKPLSTNQK